MKFDNAILKILKENETNPLLLKAAVLRAEAKALMSGSSLNDQRKAISRSPQVVAAANAKIKEAESLEAQAKTQK
jgi:hypothetical protein